MQRPQLKRWRERWTTRPGQLMFFHSRSQAMLSCRMPFKPFYAEPGEEPAPANVAALPVPQTSSGCSCLDRSLPVGFSIVEATLWRAVLSRVSPSTGAVWGLKRSEV